MSRCLDERELVMFHAGDGSSVQHEHLETCLGCARKYRELQSEMETLVAALRRAPQARGAGRVSHGEVRLPRTLRWALAASVVIAAFAGGRMMGLSTSAPPMLTATASSHLQGGQLVMADGELTPASYGLYINDLMDADAADQNQQAADQGDADSQMDPDSGAF